MNRIMAHLLLAVCVAGLVRADQATHSVQQALKDQGFYYGNVTGDKSAETTAAIRRYQIRNGLQVTGDINPETLRSLNVNSTSNSPSGPNRRLETNPPFFGAPNQSVPRRINERIALAEVQHQLMTRGYYRGRVDGRYGRRTAFAVRAFPFQSGLPPNGRLDTSTLNALGLSDENLAYFEPAPRSYETWVPVTKFKHGKWKVKWKKRYREGPDEYGLEDRERDRDDWSYGEGHDD